uniref:Polycystin domain-containing protein n=1 Tax=Ciona savignyi TaxID=51511 RepID=H2Y6Q6_CIOSA
ERTLDWWIPFEDIPQGVSNYNLTIHASLGAKYFRLGSVLKTLVTTYAVNCLYWDDDIFDWDNQGCRVSDVLTTDPNIHCHRDVPTLFASRLIVYPNKIDYSKLSLDLWKKFLENPIIFVCLFILYTSYAVLVTLARVKDVECEDKQAYIEVVDNSPADNYRYYVTLYTGNRRVAGTSAVVCIKFLQRIVVRDLETNECTFFICKKWFYDDIDHIFPAARTKELHTFDSLFQIKCENYLKDQHMWYSILAMRPWQQSDMSRVERLSACYLLIFMIMLTSLMFYGREVSQPGFKIDLGYYSFKWSQIAIGLESGLLCYPLTYIVTTLFRYSQPRLKSRTKNKDLLRLERGESIRPYSKHEFTSSSGSEFDDMSLAPRTVKTSEYGRNGITGKITKLQNDLPENTCIDIIKDNRKQSSTTRQCDNKFRINHLKKNKLPEGFRPLKERRIKQQSRRDAETQTPQSMRTRRKQLRMKRTSNSGEFPGHNPNNSTNRYVDPKMVGSNPRSYTMVDIDPFSFDFRPLPWFFVYFAWFIMLTTILGSSVLCVMYGMTYGVEISKEWLISLLSGFIQSIILIEPFKAVFLASFNVINNPKHDLKDWLAPVPDFFYPQQHGDPQLLEDRLINERSKNPAYQPPTRCEVLEGQKQRALERKLRRRLKRISVHLLYLAFLFIVAFGQRGQNSFQFGQAINRMFINDASKITSHEGIYKWIENSLADSLFSNNEIYFPDGQFVFVSRPLLRQKRVITVLCEHSDAKLPVKLGEKTPCRLGFDYAFEDRKSYGASWSKRIRYLYNQHYDVNNSPWSYTALPWTWISDYFGEHANYGNGGYYVTIPDAAKTKAMAQYLRLAQWIDKNTRAIIFEAVFYNVPHRIYCVTIIAIEISTSGNVYVSSRLHLMRTH